MIYNVAGGALQLRFCVGVAVSSSVDGLLHRLLRVIVFASGCCYCIVK